MKMFMGRPPGQSHELSINIKALFYHKKLWMVIEMIFMIGL
jgi:hypothetical protein